MICTLVWSDHACDWLQLDVNSGYVQISQLVLMILSFILLSTQFEKQADAYAAVDYSKSVGQEVITPEAVENLSLALSAIADTNQIPIDRGDLLHGSIQQRQKNLEDLVGCPLDNIPINQRVNKIKIALVVLIFLGIVV
jgi:hypothetical protein